LILVALDDQQDVLAGDVVRIAFVSRRPGRSALLLSALVCLSAGCAGPGQRPAKAENPQSSSAASSAAADTALATYDLRELSRLIESLSEGAERDYVAGMLAVRSGRFEAGSDQLTRALPLLRESAPKRAAVALEALGTAYRATNRHTDAARVYRELADRFASQLEHFPEDDAGLALIMRDAPAQQIAWHGQVRLKSIPNAIGTRNVVLTANGLRERWLIDTGANQNVVTRGFLKRLGLTTLPGTAPVRSGLTGLESSIQAAILPTLALGGATLTDVPLLVIDDKNLRIGPDGRAYQIHAVLGYPTFRALGTVTFTASGQFVAGDTEKPSTASTPLFMRGLTPVVEGLVDGHRLLFTLDTGANITTLSSRYFELFKTKSNTWTKVSGETGGAGGTVQQTFFSQPSLEVAAGSGSATLSDVSILSERTNAAIDILFGNLGQDFVDGFERVTIDFAKMTFVGVPRSRRP
jgi:predicted aspartyl protease